MAKDANVSPAAAADAAPQRSAVGMKAPRKRPVVGGKTVQFKLNVGKAKKTSESTAAKIAKDAAEGDLEKAVTKKKKVIQIRALAAKVKKIQNDNKVVLPKAPFERAVREIALSFDPKHRITQSALEVARRSVEAVAMDFTWKVNMFARHAKRTTIQPVDFDLLQAVSPIANIPIVDYAAPVADGETE